MVDCDLFHCLVAHIIFLKISQIIYIFSRVLGSICALKHELMTDHGDNYSVKTTGRHSKIGRTNAGQGAQRILALGLGLALVGLALIPTANATTTIFGPFPPITTAMGVGKIAVTPPTTNSPGPWSFTSSNSRVATVDGNVLSILSAGSTTITATQAASGVFTSRSRSTLLHVNPGTPTIGVFPSQSVSITQGTFKLVPPTSTSEGLWSFATGDPLIASLSGNILTLLDGGNVVITATQSNTLNWNAAVTKMTLTVVAIAPVLGTFGSITIQKDSVASLTLTKPTSTSPGLWTFTSSNPTIATVNGTTLTPVGIGTSTITASQAHIGNFASAKISMTLTVQGVLPTVGTLANLTTPLTATLLVITPPTSNSNGTWSYTSSDPTVATVTNGVIKTLKFGTTTITAIQAATSTFSPSPPVTMLVTIFGNPTIGAWSGIDKVVKDPDFSLNPPTSTSNGVWSYLSSNPSVVEIVNGLARVKGAGQAVITANQAATPIWAAASAQMTIHVFGAIPALGAFLPIVVTVGDPALTIKAPVSDSTGSWVFTSSDNKIFTTSGTTLSGIGAGTATITATQSPAGIYSQSNTVSTTVTVKAKPIPTPAPSPTVTPSPTPKPTSTPSSTPTPKPTSTTSSPTSTTSSPTPTPSATPKVGDFPNLKITFGTVAPAINFPTTPSVAPWTLKSSNSAVVTFVDTIIQMRGPGIATITATQAATANTPVIKKTFIIEVLPPAPASAAPIIKVTAAGKVITVSVKGAVAKISIDGVPAKVGANSVKAGVRKVSITIAGKIVYSKVFTIK